MITLDYNLKKCKQLTSYMYIHYFHIGLYTLHFVLVIVQTLT